MTDIWPLHRRSFVTGSLLALATSQAASAQQVQTVQAGGYICAECGCASDGKLFAAPADVRDADFAFATWKLSMFAM